MTNQAEALLAALDARDGYTGAHSRSVVELAGRVAERLGLSERERADAAHVARLHDVGKITVPDAILKKPGPLDRIELELIRGHTVVGERIVRRIPGLEHLAPAVRASHERWDGRGYPDGLAGERIPVSARITSACDAFDAMTSDRPYRRALSRGDARAELERGAGTQFDPVAVEALLAVAP